MRRIGVEPELADREPLERDFLSGPDQRAGKLALGLQLITALARAFVVLFMPLNALLLGFLVGRRFDSAWAMLGTVAVCFVAGEFLFPPEP
jgi:lipopolysaccharide export LptBFGC system permease protein LptF